MYIYIILVNDFTIIKIILLIIYVFYFQKMTGMRNKICFLCITFVTLLFTLYAGFNKNTFLGFAAFREKNVLKYIRVPGSVTNSIINISSLPVAETFSPLHFYGERSLLKYQWYFKPNKTKSFPLNYRFLQKPYCRFNTSLVILVMSLHHMTSQRQAIRDTWGSVSNSYSWPNSNQHFSIEVFFVLGINKNSSLNTAVAMEAAEKKDVIVAQFDDSYFNLTLKVLLAFKWTRDFCSTAKYVMKVDEDTYINIPKFVDLLHSQQMNNTLLGPYFFTSLVERMGKFAVSKSGFPASKYPPHLKGNAYVMPTDVSMKILAVSEYMPYVNIEDCEITGILAKIFNFRHIGFKPNQYYLTKAASSCELVTGSTIVSQQIFDKTFYNIWDRVKNNSLCR